MGSGCQIHSTGCVVQIEINARSGAVAGPLDQRNGGRIAILIVAPSDKLRRSVTYRRQLTNNGMKTERCNGVEAPPGCVHLVSKYDCIHK
jgi:hypothetical protein